MSPPRMCCAASLRGSGGSHKTPPITLCEPNEAARRGPGYLRKNGGGNWTPYAKSTAVQQRVVYSNKQANKYSYGQSTASKKHTSTVTFGQVPRLENCQAAEGLFSARLHGLPLTPSVTRWRRLNCSMDARSSNSMYGS